jgi:hypothetical protein
MGHRKRTSCHRHGRKCRESVRLVAFAILVITFGLGPLTAAALMVAYEWSRVHLRDHRPLQVAIGAITGALAVAAASLPL